MTPATPPVVRANLLPDRAHNDALDVAAGEVPEVPGDGAHRAAELMQDGDCGQLVVVSVRSREAEQCAEGLVLGLAAQLTHGLERSDLGEIRLGEAPLAPAFLVDELVELLGRDPHLSDESHGLRSFRESTRNSTEEDGPHRHAHQAPHRVAHTRRNLRFLDGVRLIRAHTDERTPSFAARREAIRKGGPRGGGHARRPGRVTRPIAASGSSGGA